MITRRATVMTFAALAAGAGISSARAGALPMPSDRIILTVSGKIANTNQPSAAVFDRAMLDALDQATIHTATPWFTGVVTFDGVPMTELMNVVGASGTTLVVRSLNDYVSEIPIDDFTRYKPILASRRDGHAMPVRDKGPLFIVYPYDSSAELMSQKFYSRSPWNIVSIEIK